MQTSSDIYLGASPCRDLKVNRIFNLILKNHRKPVERGQDRGNVVISPFSSEETCSSILDQLQATEQTLVHTKV